MVPNEVLSLLLPSVPCMVPLGFWLNCFPELKSDLRVGYIRLRNIRIHFCPFPWFKNIAALCKRKKKQNKTKRIGKEKERQGKERALPALTLQVTRGHEELEVTIFTSQVKTPVTRNPNSLEHIHGYTFFCLTYFA